jgi:hypothetical protein
MTCQTSLMTLIWLLKSLKRMKPYIFQVTVVVFFLAVVGAYLLGRKHGKVEEEKS